MNFDEISSFLGDIEIRIKNTAVMRNNAQPAYAIITHMGYQVIQPV